MFSWMRGKDSAPAAPANVSTLLSRTEYMADYEAAQVAAQQLLAQNNPLVKQLERCADIQQHLGKCLEEHPTSDPKCLLLHQAWIICAAREVAPAQHATFAQCAARHRAKPELCEGDFQTMWNGVNAAVSKAEMEMKKRAMNDVEEEALLDCKGYKELADKALLEHGGESAELNTTLERWMQCVFPKTCESDWRTYERCLASKGTVDGCIEEGA